MASDARVVQVALAGATEAETRLVDLVAGRLGRPTRRFEVPASGLPGLLNRTDARMRGAFTLTPQALVESWRVARHLERATEPGDTLVLADRAGLSGVFVLEQAMRDPADRRRTIVAAGSGRALAAMAAFGQIDGLEAEVAAEVDWELVAYRFADAVVTCSPLAAAAITAWGARPQLVDPRPTDAPPVPALPPRARTIGVPEPFSRVARAPQVLRGLGAVPAARAPEEIHVSSVDVEDQVWSGTTWEASRGMRAALGARVRRSDEPAGEILVLGHPLDLPDGALQRRVASGTPVIVPADGASALWWPDAPRWTDEESLARALAGRDDASTLPAAVRVPELLDRPADPGRARRVSVGIPVFRDVRFLDEAVRSLLAQSEQPHEILLVDDGSGDAHVDDALDRWARERPDLVRVHRQSNLGVCVARNRMIEAMTGDAFVLIDADDVLEPTFIEACATALRGDARLTAVATWTAFFGDYEGVEAKPPFDARVGRRENTIVSTCVLMDMAVREQGIRYDPDLAWIFCEDWDVWAKTVAAGGAFGLVPAPLARHRVHPSSGGFQRTPLALALGRARATGRLPAATVQPGRPMSR